MCLMPSTRFMRRRETGPASSMSGTLLGQLLEHHPDLEAGQVGAEAEVGASGAEGHVVVGVPGDVELAGGGPELLLVAVGRWVPEHDLLARGDGLAAEHGVGGGGAAEEVDRAGPAQDLLDHGVGQLGVGDPSVPLVAVLHEGDEALGDCVAGRLVAGHDEEGEEQVALEVGELGGGAVLHRDPGIGELGPHVVARVGPLVVAHLVGVDRHLHDDVAVVRARLLGRCTRSVLAVLAADHPVAPVEQPASVLGRHADDLGDGQQRQFGRHVDHEVAFTRRRDPVEHGVGLLAQRCPRGGGSCAV